MHKIHVIRYINLGAMEYLKNKFGYKFFFYSIALWTLVLSMRFIHTEFHWLRIVGELHVYLILIGALFVVSFLNKARRIDAFLSEICTLTPLFFTTIIGQFRTKSEITHSFCVIVASAIIIYYWIEKFLKNKRHQLKRIIIPLSVGMILPIIIMTIEAANYLWSNFWVVYAYAFSHNTLLFVGYIIGVILHYIKGNKSLIYISIPIILGIIVWCSLYLTRFIITYFEYGSIWGKTEKVFSFNVTNELGESKNFSEYNEPYKICFIDDIVNSNVYYNILRFEKLSYTYTKYSFWILNVERKENKERGIEDPFKVHANDHYHVPLLNVENPKKFWKDFDFFPESAIICIFKNDTIIYQNSIEETQQYLNDNVLK